MMTAKDRQADCSPANEASCCVLGAGKSSDSIRDGRKMICGGCSLSRYQHYCAVPDRWSVAMTITFVAVASADFSHY
jgi:hypothetical protein